MKYAVLGAGALGSVIGGLLQRGGCDTVLWDINQPHIDAINANGLKLDLPTGSEHVPVPAGRPDEGADADVILVLTKSHHLDIAIKSVADRIDRGARVLGLQNGLTAEHQLSGVVPAEQLFIGCVRMPGRFLAAGHVASQGNGNAVFRAAKSGQQVDFTVEVPGFALIHDAQSADTIIWQKAAFNCALNAIMALQGGTLGHLADNQEGVHLAKDAAAEVVAVARAKGVNANLSEVEAHMDRSLTQHRAHKPSMLQDIETGRETEIDALCGAVVREAEKLGIDVPINRTLAVLVRQKSDAQKDLAA